MMKIKVLRKAQDELRPYEKAIEMLKEAGIEAGQAHTIMWYYGRKDPEELRKELENQKLDSKVIQEVIGLLF